MPNGSGGRSRSTRTEVVPYERYAVAQVGVGALMDTLRENVGPGQLSVFDLDRVKIPAGGSTTWSVPTLEGEAQDARTLDGVVVYHREPRAFWQTPFAESGGGTPPDCASQFGDIGIGTPGGECAVCPLSQWGSKPHPTRPGEHTRGQACKQTKLVALLQPDALLPTVVFVPPTSLKPMRSYLLGLASRSRPYWSVVTSLALEKAKNADGLEYSQVAPRLLDTLSPEAAASVKEYADAMRAALDAITIERTDLPEEADQA
jgi:hypothetical protein